MGDSNNGHPRGKINLDNLSWLFSSIGHDFRSKIRDPLIFERKSWPIDEKSQDKLSRLILPLGWPLLLSPIYAPCKRVFLQ